MAAQATTRLGELQRWADLIHNDRVSTFKQYMYSIIDQIKNIEGYMNTEDTAEVAKLLNELEQQYSRITDKAITHYTALADRLDTYVTQSRNNIQKILDSLASLNQQISECEQVLDTVSVSNL